MGSCDDSKLLPMRKDQLQREAEAWLGLVQTTCAEIAERDVQSRATTDAAERARLLAGRFVGQLRRASVGQDQLHGDITRAVKDQFDAAGVSIPFPQRDVHVHQVAAT